MKLGANRAELVQLMQKFMQRSRVEFFATKAPDPYHWIPNSCSCAFRNDLGAFGPIHYCMKQGANRAELVQLMQEFMQRSGVKNFRNEGTRSIPLHPKLLFRSIS